MAKKANTSDVNSSISSINSQISTLNTRIDNNSTNKLEKVSGVLFNSDSSTIGVSSGDALVGHGVAIVRCKEHVATIFYNVTITAASNLSVDCFTNGFNRDYLYQQNSNIPVITPSIGTCIVFRNNVRDGSLNGYGGYLAPINQFWQVGRNFDLTNVGGWPSRQFAVGDNIFAVAYGSY